MTEKEFAVFASYLRTYYPRENILPNKQAMGMWYDELKDLSYDVVMIVLRQHVHTSKWSPSISEIREKAAEIQTGTVEDWGSGWQKVMGAIRRFGMYREAEALESMDEVTRATVQRLGFQNICLSENIIADRARFKDIYEQLAERKKRENNLPEGLRLAIKNAKAENMIEKAAESMRIGTGKTGEA